MQKDINFTSFDDIQPFLDIAWKKYCIDNKQCRIATCPVNALMVNLESHTAEENKVLIFGDMIVFEMLGSNDES